MPTISFDVALGEERAATPTAYFVELLGDLSEPTAIEEQIVMRKLAVHAARIRAKAHTAHDAVPLVVEPHEATELLCDHYTIRILRKDGQSLAPSEVTFALLTYEYARLDFERQREHVVAMPLSTLRQLLDASKSTQVAFTAAIEEMSPSDQAIDLTDESVARELMSLGLLIPAEHPDHYLLQDLELQ
jgi:hypothetical protein